MGHRIRDIVILLVSGGIAVGKSTVAVQLAAATDGSVLRVRQALADALHIAPDDRGVLQAEGAALDERTQGRWLLHHVQAHPEMGQPLIIDALRTRRQTLPLLSELPDAHLVHLTAHVGVRRIRYGLGGRTDPLKARVSFDQAVAHETERSSDEIRDLADLQIETDDLSARAVADLILDHFRLRSTELGTAGT